ncbi:MAG: trehalose-phosphatase [Betaproteobacteria bacterium]|nr:trehalose-phosphatase [Betaproteobacteria bacterium]
MQAPTQAGEPGAPDASAGGPAWTAQAAVFLDIDGTLVPHEERPDAVHIDAALRALLERVRVAAGGALALISGRSIADIDALFSPAVFAVAGQHGAERRGADGRLHFHSPRASRLRGQAERLRELVRAHPALLLEEKGASLALHYRGDPALGGLAEREARRAVVALGDDFELLAGKFVFEVKASGRDKGSAIEEFMAEEPFAGRRPVFVGDDLTDELGFERVNRLGGDSVKVGAGPTRARWRLADARAVRDWLSGLGATGGDGAAQGRKG